MNGDSGITNDFIFGLVKVVIRSVFSRVRFGFFREVRDLNVYMN